MKSEENIQDDSDKLRDIFNIWPTDTISLIASNSCISPSDAFARELNIAESLKPLRPIKNKDDAELFDAELVSFVTGIRTAAIDPKKYKHFTGLDEQLTAMRWLMSSVVYQYTSFDGMPLGDLYEKCKGNYRILSIFLDFKINFANFSAYIYELLGVQYQIQNTPNSIPLRMRLQFYANACVMTCRATWDKLMGVIVLVELGAQAYENFLNSSSKKKYIRKHMEEIDCEEFPRRMLEEFLEVITKLDNTFRTQEAHGSGGKIRNAAFSDGSLTDTILMEIVGHYNYLHEYLDNHWHDVGFLDEKPKFIEALVAIL